MILTKLKEAASGKSKRGDDQFHSRLNKRAQISNRRMPPLERLVTGGLECDQVSVGGGGH